MFHLLLGFITAFILTYTIIPLIVDVAHRRSLYDKPNERSAHKAPTPSLGGIGIFAGMVCGIVLWTPLASFGMLQYLLAAFLLIFLTGVLDDLLPLSPYKKLGGQILTAVILAFKGKVTLSGMYGLLGIWQLPEFFSFLLSLFLFVALINAFNLIDGVNLLAGGIGLLACVFWGIWFYLADEMGLAMVSLSLAGSLSAFLKFNHTPAKIFMGDTGAMLIGAVCAVLAIQFIEKNHAFSAGHDARIGAAPAISVAVLIVPITDTLSVMTRRVLGGRSPFSADKTHLHHQLLRLGLSHEQTSGALILATLSFTALCYILQDLGFITLLWIEALLAIGAVLSLFFLEKNKQPKSGKP
ncbi:MAG: glycosyltransferase family 4 protein [Saprospiraceae bacterium]